MDLTLGLAVAALLGLLVWWWRQRRAIAVDEHGVSLVPNDDRDMERAIAHARENFHFFVERLRDPRPGDENFAVKVAITHDGNTEHLWLSDVRVDGDVLEGEIANEPQLVPMKLGERWRGDRSRLSDWTFFSDGRMQGNFTLRAMLPRMPKAQRDPMRALLEGRWDTRELVHRPWPAGAPMPGRPLADDLSHGDGVLMAGVQRHLDAHLGELPQVFHELVSPSAHIDLYPYPATAERPFHVVATTGMAERPMQLPDGVRGDAHVELMLLLPPQWPLDAAAWQDERHYWPLRWLKRVARFHYETGRWLGEGHVLTHGEPPTPIDASTACDAVLLARPARLPAALHRVRLDDGREVRFLCLYFLDAEQRAQLEERGFEDLCSDLATRLSVRGCLATASAR